MNDDLDTPDDELIKAYHAGDNRAFDRIVDRYERRVYAVALRMTGNTEDARDITQDVFISAMRALKRFRGDAKLSTWLHRVAVNASLDLARKRARRPAQPLSEAPDQAGDEPGPADQAVRADRAAAVHAALATISQDHRAVLVLHDLQGLDYAEVAQALDVPVGTVKSRIHRARLEMARLLGHLRETEPSQGHGPLTDEP